MFEEFFKVDRSMGESRGEQILGAILLIVVFVGSAIFMYYR